MADDLEELSGIGKATADRMRAIGIDSISRLANASPDDFSKLKGVGKATAVKYIENAKKYLKQSKSSELKEELSKEKEMSQKKSSSNSESLNEVEQSQVVAEEEKAKAKKEKKTQTLSTDIRERMKQQAECNIGTAGHVDSGKTTLVNALTGEWTDRHSEEQERGISIKLGYSNTTILYCPACDLYLTDYMAEFKRQEGQSEFTCYECKGQLIFKRNISFVDSPGHEILMATMLSGASIMDGAMLLVAADEECPQPQTREHLAALNIAGIKKIIIIQNKIDAVPKEQAIKNYNQIKVFVKGTVAENAPIIPVSSIYRINLELIIRAFEEIIPTPEFDEKEDFQFLIARSFDINRPGKEIEDLKGGVIGGSILKGKIRIGEQIEIRPGLHVKNQYVPIKSIVVSISQGKSFFEEAKPGGLIGLGTQLDPTLTKGDALIGNLAGRPDILPPILSDVELEIHLLDRVIGTEDQMKVQSLKHNEKLLLVVGTEKTAGTIVKILKDKYVLKLTPPICPPENFIYAISRIINRRYRLIGYGLNAKKK